MVSAMDVRTALGSQSAFPMPHGLPLVVAAAHYELLYLARGDGATAVLDTPFEDVHVHRDRAVHRFVAGYLGVEADVDRSILTVTSHGRPVATVTAPDAHTILLERAPDPAWPDGGFAVLA